MKYNTLESLRGIAAIIVVLFHSGFVDGEKSSIIAQGRIFVDFFFILSGFVMAYAYTNKITDGLSFKEFTILRFGRLYPLHLFTLLLWLPYVLAKVYAYQSLGLGGDPTITNNLYTFVCNLFLINSLGINDSHSWNYPAWSISVEFFTYLIFFTFIYSIKSSFKPVYLGVFSLCSYAALYLLSDDTLLSSYEFGIFRCVGGFFFGAYLLHLSKSFELALTKATASILEVFVVILALFLVNNSFEDKVFQLSSFLAFGVIIIVFAIQHQGIISSLLKHRFMILLGTLSYSIYMLHAIVFAMLGNIYQFILKYPVVFSEHNGVSIRVFNTPYADVINLITVVFIIFLSYFSYTYIEKPWRNRFRKLANKNSTLSSSPEASKVKA